MNLPESQHAVFQYRRCGTLHKEQFSRLRFSWLRVGTIVCREAGAHEGWRSQQGDTQGDEENHVFS
jgi:hypothetical protein